MSSPVELAWNPSQFRRIDCDGLRGRRLALLGHRLLDFLPVLRVVDPDVALVCEAGPEVVTLAKDAGVDLRSTELASGHRSVRVSSDIDELIDFAGTLGDTVTQWERLDLLAYCATPRWEQAVAAASGRLRLHAPPASLKLRLDDKIDTRSQFVRLGIPTPPHTSVATSELDFSLLAGRFGTRFVLQRPFGSAGFGTFEIQDAADLSRAVLSSPGVTRWLVSARLEGTVVNVHGLVGRERVEAAWPSVQLSGIEGLSLTSATYGGNDFGACSDLPARVLASVKARTVEIGRWLSEIDYRGIFGVDFVVHDGEAFALEVNPRLQGSTWVLGEIETAAGAVSLTVRHFVELMGSTAEVPSLPASPPTGAYVVLRWCGQSATRLGGQVLPGSYTLDEYGRLQFRRPVIGLLECSADEFLVTGLPPDGGAFVEPGAPIARVAAWSRLCEADGRSLTAQGRRIVAAVLAQFEPLSLELAGLP